MASVDLFGVDLFGVDNIDTIIEEAGFSAKFFFSWIRLNGKLDYPHYPPTITVMSNIAMDTFYQNRITHAVKLYRVFPFLETISGVYGNIYYGSFTNNQTLWLEAIESYDKKLNLNYEIYFNPSYNESPTTTNYYESNMSPYQHPIYFKFLGKPIVIVNEDSSYEYHAYPVYYYDQTNLEYLITFLGKDGSDYFISTHSIPDYGFNDLELIPRIVKNSNGENIAIFYSKNRHYLFVYDKTNKTFVKNTYDSTYQFLDIIYNNIDGKIYVLLQILDYTEGESYALFIMDPDSFLYNSGIINPNQEILLSSQIPTDFSTFYYSINCYLKFDEKTNDLWILENPYLIYGKSTQGDSYKIGFYFSKFDNNNLYLMKQNTHEYSGSLYYYSFMHLDSDYLVHDGSVYCASIKSMKFLIGNTYYYKSSLMLVADKFFPLSWSIFYYPNTISIRYRYYGKG